MNRNDTIQLLAFLQAADHRTVGEADIAFWQTTIPENVDLPLAIDAVRAFFSAPAERPDERVFFTTRHLMHYVRVVRERRRSQAARQSAIEATEQARRALAAPDAPEALDGPLTGRVIHEVTVTSADGRQATSPPVFEDANAARQVQAHLQGFGRMP